MRDIILVDIDHVISDAFWRDDMIKKARDSGRWEEYHSAGKNDKPLEDVIVLINHIARYNTIIQVWAITARPAKWLKQTNGWLLRHGVMVENVLMRPEEAFKPAPQIKIDLCKEHKILDRILCIFDDREDVIAAFKELGITAFQVHARRGNV
jgi:hypothetical protein